MSKYGDVCNFSPIRVQPLNSELCGHYCIYFAHKHCQGYDMEYILNNMPDRNFIKKFSESYLKSFENTQCEKLQCCIKN